MGIQFQSNGKYQRHLVKEYLRTKRNQNPHYRVIDVGGAGNPWGDEFVDAYADFKPVAGKQTFVGEINDPSLWDEIARNHWDFCICTHTLEDSRNPDLAIRRMKQIAGAGFIAVPNKHTELSPLESAYFLGYCHHRWIFSLDGNRFRAIAKAPIVNCLSSRHWLSHLVFHILGDRGSRLLFERKAPEWIRRYSPLCGGLTWLRPDLVGGNHELAFLWEKDFDFEFINSDFAGNNSREMIRLYTEELGRGL